MDSARVTLNAVRRHLVDMHQTTSASPAGRANW
jgi:hypothetical protein